MKECCDIWKKFNSSELILNEFDYWNVVLRHKQITLGSVVIILKEHKLSFSDLSESEFKDLKNVTHWYEKLLKNKFQPAQFNYLALMMKDPHVHIHTIPRYDSVREFNGIKWIDEKYPLSVSMKMEKTPKSDLFTIRGFLLAQ